MDKEKFLRESFKDKYGKKLGQKRVALNVLLNLVAGDNIKIIEDSLVMDSDKITFNIEKYNSDEEVIIGKIAIYDGYKYYYLENNISRKTYIGLSYDNCNCQLKYKSFYDNFNIERNIDFKLYKTDSDVLYIANNLFNCPLSFLYPHMQKEIDQNKSISRNIGLLISDDMYKFFEYNIELEQKQAERKNLEYKIYNRFCDVYNDKDIDNDMKIKNEMAIVYDLVNHPNISLSSINFQGKEGFNKYQGRDLANCIEVNVVRDENGELHLGTFLICGGKYIKYNDDRMEINSVNNSLYYTLTYKCVLNNYNYIYKTDLSYRIRNNDTGLVREYISLARIDNNNQFEEIISRVQNDEYVTDKSIYYHLGELLSGKYATIIESYINAKKEIKGKKRNK